jgi:hypothetical protein
MSIGTSGITSSMAFAASVEYGPENNKKGNMDEQRLKPEYADRADKVMEMIAWAESLLAKMREISEYPEKIKKTLDTL